MTAPSAPQLQTATGQGAQREASAHEFSLRLAEEIQKWLDDLTFAGQVNGMRWVLTAALSNGREIVVERLSAHGDALIKLVGRFHDGAPCLLVAHQHSVQLVATFVPEVVEPQKGREIGFHTIIAGREIKPRA